MAKIPRYVLTWLMEIYFGKIVSVLKVFFQILIWKEGLSQVLMAFHKILPLYLFLLLRRGNHKIFIALFFSFLANRESLELADSDVRMEVCENIWIEILHTQCSAIVPAKLVFFSNKCLVFFVIALLGTK